MRKMMLAAVAATAIATPAIARDGSGYVGLEAGPMILQDVHLDYVDSNSDINDAFGLDYNTGWDADIIGGYDFGMFRVEGELGYKRAGLNKINLASEIVDTTNPDGIIDPNSGSGRALSAMANALLDFGDSGMGGYVGAGFGIARVRLAGSFDGTFSTIPATQFSFHDSDSALAWQAIAGVRFAISANMDLGLKYRYFNTAKFQLRDDQTTAELSGKWKSHSLLASLIYNFGAPEAAPPPPPPPPPPAAPPPPATQTCPDGAVILATEACPAPPPPPPPPPPAPERG